ncbi:MAG TPA: NAD(P)/FAD-dependent oxidoreductase [Candidatus Dormibacteraeota bacterium]|nr:NAD(P)/FAD-dependent oxidoreductase [Candidatus Dormibacteraeota bacterium]
MSSEDDPKRLPVVIMGAGPAGLTAAYELRRQGLPATVLERDPRYVGGIARTIEYKGYRFDIGGHRFFSKNGEIEDLWSEVLGDELLTRDRLSRIYYKGRYFDYPVRAQNALWNLGPLEAVRCLVSYARARLWPVRDPRTFQDWVSNQFGRRLTSIFFTTYTEKVWGIPSTELSADWAAQRIKGLSMTEVIRGALRPRRRSGRGEVIKTLIDHFRYPRLGPGQMWERVAELLAEDGRPVLQGLTVTRVRHASGRVIGVDAVDADGGTREFEGDSFVSTLALRDLIRGLDPPPPPEVREAAEGLGYRDFLTVALIIDREDVFPDNWIYVHDPAVKVGRLQNFKNWSPAMVADQHRTCLGLEYFCFEGDGLWSMADEDLVALASAELERLGLTRREEVMDGTVVRQPKAYPVYDDAYRERLDVVRRWLQGNLPNLELCGRNGMHKYNNQDHSMMTALLVARRIALGSQLDPWLVNADAEYHEELRQGEDRSGRLVPTRR